MISACIPVYNYNISPLIEELLTQLKLVNAPFEIIVIDDNSDEKFKKLNEGIVKNTHYIQLEKNIGRAKIRNKFLEIAQFDYLLFIDNDSRIISENYIKNYIETIKSGAFQIVFGGRIFGERPTDRNRLLRWKYGVKRESKPAHIRNLSPNKSFMTNNFIIHRSLFEKVKFNEELVEYGHEDTLFGYEIKKQGFTINHIENPVLNGDYETNDRYLIKTEKAILNLIYMLKFTNNDQTFINDVSLLKYQQQLDSLKIDCLFRWVFIIKGPIIRFLLSKGFANMTLFSFYKLGFLMINKR